MGTAGVVVGGAMSAYNGFSRGGAKGGLQGTASVLGTAAALDPEPISKGVLAAAAVITGIVASVLGDPKVQRQQQINKELTQGAYIAPIAINQTRDSTGNYVDYDKFGKLRTSNFSAIPQISEPYLHYRDGQYLNVPGGVTSQFGGGGQAQTVNYNVTNNVSAVDGASVKKFFMDNKESLGNATAAHLGAGDSALASKIGFITGTR